MLTMETARKIASDPSMCQFRNGDDWDLLRDHCDMMTGGALDSWQLDIMTDWVSGFLPNN